MSEDFLVGEIRSVPCRNKTKGYVKKLLKFYQDDLIAHKKQRPLPAAKEAFNLGQISACEKIIKWIDLDETIGRAKRKEKSCEDAVSIREGCFQRERKLACGQKVLWTWK